ncbi:hypothetical protein BDV59DRAFT_201693 [Aspergillus ambiguus]|uniref:uncharacterized protein n=1 Tax=Aspergillus ambiguus TaxID=176160 RepID=UPI003CCD2D41
MSFFHFLDNDKEKDKGGRIPQKVVDEALQFYRSLFVGKELGTTTTSKVVGGFNDIVYDPGSAVGSGGLPKLRVKKDSKLRVSRAWVSTVVVSSYSTWSKCATREDSRPSTEEDDDQMDEDQAKGNDDVQPADPTLDDVDGHPDPENAAEEQSKSHLEVSNDDDAIEATATFG